MLKLNVSWCRPPMRQLRHAEDVSVFKYCNHHCGKEKCIYVWPTPLAPVGSFFSFAKELHHAALHGRVCSATLPIALYPNLILAHHQLSYRVQRTCSLSQQDFVHLSSTRLQTPCWLTQPSGEVRRNKYSDQTCFESDRPILWSIILAQLCYLSSFLVN